ANHGATTVRCSPTAPGRRRADLRIRAPPGPRNATAAPTDTCVVCYSTCSVAPPVRWRRHSSISLGRRRDNATRAWPRCSVTDWWSKRLMDGSPYPASIDKQLGVVGKILTTLLARERSPCPGNAPSTVAHCYSAQVSPSQPWAPPWQRYPHRPPPPTAVEWRLHTSTTRATGRPGRHASPSPCSTTRPPTSSCTTRWSRVTPTTTHSTVRSRS